VIERGIGVELEKVTIVGAGLAGSEAALQLANRGVEVELHEMRPGKMTPAHHTGRFGELVCSNSLKSLDPTSAAGTLKYELAVLGSRLIDIALDSSVPAGKALAVDRDVFSTRVTEELKSNPNIKIVEGEVDAIPNGRAIVATGPLTSDGLADEIRRELGSDFFAFYDAAAPVVEAESLDMDKLFSQSRYDKGGADYLNAPFDKEGYEAFVEELLNAERVIPKAFESKDLFSACQPVEEIARSGKDALRFGPLKPVGLTNPKTGHRPWAVVQLRAENEALSAYNLVGFQTNLKHPEQERVFRMIPGLEHAEFARFGVMHRNSFIDSPHVLGKTFEIPNRPVVRFAGQITGTEGYCEAMASGLLAALATYCEIIGKELPPLPRDSMFGALVDYATDPETQDYQPMHVNYGIARPFEKRIKNKRERYMSYALRARKAIDEYRNRLSEIGVIAADPPIIREQLKLPEF
jgi:methylenetetrahydrofolate--tRNA-(uracil-5-)-methyltransferase